MRQFIIENLTNTEALSMKIIIMNNVIALIAAFFIMFTYKISHTGSLYSRKFNVSLGSVTIISNNVALSLGMVGALSIIRFRTAVKDVRDATFIFWAIAVGIGCGVSQYALISVGSVFLLLFLIIAGKGFTSSSKLLVIQGKLAALSRIEAELSSYLDRDIQPSMRNVTDSGFELVYSVDEGLLRRAEKKNQADISEKLIKITGIDRVNVIDQKDELSQ